MAAEIICDGCGKREKMGVIDHRWVKPRDWFERTPKELGGEVMLSACSRECVQKVNSKPKDPMPIITL